MAQMPRSTSPSPTSQERLDDALDDTFPASDPPSQTDPTHGVRFSQTMLDESAIRERAYDIWQRAGSPHGSDQEHWAQARRELEAEQANASP